MSSREMGLPSREVNVRRFCANIVDPNQTHTRCINSFLPLFFSKSSKLFDFKKAFDRVWHAALWATMRKYNISANLVRTIEQLYDKATSAVQMNGSIGE